MKSSHMKRFAPSKKKRLSGKGPKSENEFKEPGGHPPSKPDYVRQASTETDDTSCRETESLLAARARKSLFDDAAIAFQLGVVYTCTGNHQMARENINKALIAREKLHGPHDTTVASAREKLGDIAVKEEEYHNAYKHYDTALEILRMSEDGTTKEAMSKILIKKGDVFLKYEKKKNRAIRCYSQAFEVMGELSEENDSEVALTLIRLGYLLLEKQDFENSLKSFTAALKYDRGKNDHSTVYIVALLFLKKGDYDEAINYFQRALSLKISVLGDGHKEVVTSLQHLGFIHAKIKKFNNAVTCYEEALSIMKKHDCEFEEIMPVFNGIVDVHKKNKQLDKAIACYKDLIQTAKSRLGDHDEVADILHKLGNLYIRDGKDDEAISCFTEEGKIRKETGSNPKKIAAIFIRIGTIHISSERFNIAFVNYEEAINLLISVLDKDQSTLSKSSTVLENKLKQVEQVLRMQESFQQYEYGPSKDSLVEQIEQVLHRKSIFEPHERSEDDFISTQNVADTINDMGNLYLRLNSYEEAVCCYESSLRIKSKLASFDFSETVRANKNLGNVLLKMKSYDKAITCFEKTLRIQREILGEHHMDVASMLCRLGSTSAMQKNLIKAVEYYTDALRIKKLGLGENHPEVTKILIDMATIYYTEKRYKEAHLLCKDAIRSLAYTDTAIDQRDEQRIKKLIQSLEKRNIATAS